MGSLTTRSEYLALRTRFHILLQRSIAVGSQLLTAEQVDLLEEDDAAWDRIDLLLREFFQIQQEIDHVLRLGRKLQKQLN